MRQPLFECRVEPERASVRVVPIGEVDLETAGRVGGEIDDLLNAGFRRVVLDLREVTFLDSTGLRMIMRARAAASAHGAQLRLEPGPPEVQRIFEVTHTEAHLFDGHHG
jgi:anti-sigma B factor antagonist